MEKHRVVIAFHKEDSVEYDPIYANTAAQAEQVAMAMLKDSRRDFEELKDIRACALATNKK